ncbi:MAG: iron dicitrate transport regulator FecR, partial [Bacteroidales bacterium]|nr:iron dicitrate transport regulator FecR [Bacteroidales bacterium]
MSSKYGEEIRRVLDQEADAIRSIPIGTDYDEVIELIYAHIHQRGGKIIASGMGKAGHVANH